MNGLRVRWRTFATIAFVGLLLSPLLGTGDGFPLSTYPMYAAPRAADATFIVAIGVSSAGVAVELPMTVVAGTRDPLIAEAYLRDAVSGGAGRLDQVCAAMAVRVEVRQVDRIEIRSQRHDLGRRGSGSDTIVDDRLIASCDVS